MRTKRLGDMLLELGLITQDQLKEALEFQAKERSGFWQFPLIQKKKQERLYPEMKRRAYTRFCISRERTRKTQTRKSGNVCFHLVRWMKRCVPMAVI